MKGDLVYNFIVYIFLFIIFEISVALINQFYVPENKNYDDLTPTQKLLFTLRYYLNVIELIIITYVLFKFGQYLNYLTIIFLIFTLLAIFRYFLFSRGLIYYFVDNAHFIEGTLGKFQNMTILILSVFIVLRIYFYQLV